MFQVDQAFETVWAYYSYWLQALLHNTQCLFTVSWTLIMLITSLAWWYHESTSQELLFLPLLPSTLLPPASGHASHCCNSLRGAANGRTECSMQHSLLIDTLKALMTYLCSQSNGLSRWKIFQCPDQACGTQEIWFCGQGATMLCTENVRGNSIIV